MKRHIFLILLIIFPILLYSANNNNDDKYFFETISPESGFVFNAITTINSDKNHFIWFGCENGLYCYNGQSFQKYYYKKGDVRTIPSNLILKIYKDSSKRMWICTRKGLAYFDENRNNFKRINFPKNIPSEVKEITELSPNRFICLLNNKLYLYNHEKKTIKAIKIGGKNINTFIKESNKSILVGTLKGSLYRVIISPNEKVYKIYNGLNDGISSICIDRDWIYLGYKESGLQIINDKGRLIKSYSTDSSIAENKFPNNKVRKILKKDNGEIWVGTFGGLIIMNNSSLKVLTLENSKLSSNSIYDIFVENENIWVGSWSGGLSFYNSHNYHFEKKVSLNNNIEKIGTVSSFAQKDNNTLWIGTEREGVLLFDLLSKKIIKRIPINLNVKSLLYHNNKLWIGTVEHGLYVLDGNSDIPKKIELKEHFNKMIVSSILAYGNKLWLGTRGIGIVEYNTDTKETTHFNFKKYGSRSNWIWQMSVDNHGDVFACSEDGLLIKKDSESFFNKVSLNDELLLYSIVAKGNCEYILGSKNDGLFTYNSSTNKLSKFIINGDLTNFDIYTLQKDESNRVWMSTNNGIYSYDLNRKELKHYTSVDGLLGNQYHPCANTFINHEFMFWGGFNGFSYINANKIYRNNVNVDVFPINILVNEHSILSINEANINTQYIPDINSIELKHYDNNLTFRFSTNNMLKPQKNRIRYRLNGYEQEWHNVKQTSDIVYSKLPPGEYYLEYVGSNNDKVWSKNYKRIDIIINPPFYQTNFAYFLYLILFSSFGILLYKFFKGRITLKREIELERYKNNIDQQALSERTKFFMNISHELCTPLNLINAPLSILENKYLDKDAIFHLSTIRRNTNTLLKLTEQILDMRLLEVNKVNINKKNFDFNELCKNIILNFDYYIKSKNIDFSYKSDNTYQKVIADKNMLEKVVYNLLSNAIKFTGENGKIDFNVYKKKVFNSDYENKFFVGYSFEGMALSFELCDNGSGIPKDKYNTIFERFQTLQVNDQEGSGIGLHICKEFISMHKGNIILESDLGKGSKFIVNIPLLKEDDIEKEKSPIVYRVKIDKTEEDELELLDEQESITNVNRLILIIADNDETIFYLKHSLNNYRCLIAKNKESGLKLSKEGNPDIMIIDSSSSMNEDSNFIKQLKADKVTMHIPIIILSAVSDQQTQYKCICAGADLFLSKPIEENLLRKHIDRLLNKSISIKPSLDFSKDIPQDFMKKVDFIIEENLHNWDFDVNMLAAKMNISRSSLFRKIKADSNCNISEYIKEKRLNRSISLMKSNCTNIEEIATASGFNSSSYFCRCFKTTFGKTPKEYIKELK